MEPFLALFKHNSHVQLTKSSIVLLAFQKIRKLQTILLKCLKIENVQGENTLDLEHNQKFLSAFQAAVICILLLWLTMPEPLNIVIEYLNFF